jgi:hypothetical protein
VIIRLSLITFFALALGIVHAQIAPEFLAMGSLSRGKWEKAKKQLTKALKKDSLNAAAAFGHARYYFEVNCPDFQIDSAWKYTRKAETLLLRATEKQRDRWRKLPLDSVVLTRHRQQIDSAAFSRAVHLNTEAAYVDFLNRFTGAIQSQRAAELRDEVAFLEALKINTHQAYQGYIQKYPTSVRAPEAKAKFDKLLFEANTKDKKIKSYEDFLTEYPDTPYRKEAERQILEILTASGLPNQFEKFLKAYPQSYWLKLAKDILYHILKEEEKSIPSFVLSDSLQKLQTLEKYYLVPFLKDGLFGFMDERGHQIIPPQATEIDDDYLCGNISEELLVMNDAILARNQSVIFKGTIIEVEALGYGFLKIVTEGCVKVVHYSGFEIAKSHCLEDAKILGKNFLALKDKAGWAVWTFTDRMLLPFLWDEIEPIGDVLGLSKAGKFNLIKTTDVAAIANQNELNLLESFDEVKAWPLNRIWARKADTQKVFTPQLTDWIEQDKHELTSTFFGAMGKSVTGYKVYKTMGATQVYDKIKLNKPWVTVHSALGWQFLNTQTLLPAKQAYDSIAFNGPLAVAFRTDSTHVYFASSSYISIAPHARLQFISGKDSVYFFTIDEYDKRKLYDAFGNERFTVSFDRIDYNNEGFFTVYKKEKRGLLDSSGKLVVPADYDAMGTVLNGVVAVLKDKKFGLIHIKDKKQIKPEYEKNIIVYSNDILTAHKKGLYGFIGWNNKPMSLFEFEEVIYWSDSSALVKKNFNWMIYNIYERQITVDKIKKVKWVKNTAEEKILIIQQENSYGVISNMQGVIIPPTFSDIVNLGSANAPLYFTEKHVEEASIFVVIYYNKNGEQIMRQVFELEDYEKIYCGSGNY